MQSPIFGCIIQSKFDALGEIPIVSTFSSPVRFVKGTLCGVWDIVRLASGRGNLADLKQDFSDMVRSVFEVFPIVNMIAALYFNYCDEWNFMYDIASISTAENLPNLKQCIQELTNKKPLDIHDRIALSVYQKVATNLENKAEDGL